MLFELEIFLDVIWVGNLSWCYLSWKFFLMLFELEITPDIPGFHPIWGKLLQILFFDWERFEKKKQIRSLARWNWCWENPVWRWVEYTAKHKHSWAQLSWVHQKHKQLFLPAISGCISGGNNNLGFLLCCCWWGSMLTLSPCRVVQLKKKKHFCLLAIIRSWRDFWKECMGHCPYSGSWKMVKC